MNPFEGKNIQCKRNDAIDSGIGFAIPFAVFTTMFIIATIVDFVSM